MLQFGTITYQDTVDFPKSMIFVDEFKKTYKLNEISHQLIKNAIESNPGIGKALLIYARLFFWKIIDIYDFIQVARSKINTENYKRLGIYERNELECCIGYDLLRALTDNNVLSINKILNVLPPSEGQNYINTDDEVWCYIPPPTGFFSIIENIIYAKFFCKLRNKIFQLDTRHDWWRYPIAFLELMDRELIDELNLSKTPTYYLTWDVLRHGINQISSEDYNQFSIFKYIEYSKIKRSLQTFYNLGNKYLNLDAASCVVYVRGGDKIILETMQRPEDLFAKDIAAIQDLGLPIYILSDDFRLAEEVCMLYGNNNTKNITKNIFNGYFYGRSNTIEDFYAIIENYLILSSCEHSLSCPSSNLVNSAHWSNRQLKNNVVSQSIPISKYLFL